MLGGIDMLQSSVKSNLSYSDPVVHWNRNVTIGAVTLRIDVVAYLIDEGGWTSRSLLDPPLEGHVDKELQ